LERAEAVTESDLAPLYVYAIVAARSASAERLQGLDGTDIGFVRHRSTAAAVGPAGANRVRPTRSNLQTHHQVVADLHKRGPVLPMRFGTVMPGQDAVIQNLLEPGSESHAQRLRELRRKDEYRLRARYLPDVALREAVQKNSAIRRLRSRSQAGGRVSQGERLHLGELVFAALERIRETDAAEILDRLAPHLEAIRTLDDPTEEVALSAAVLLDRRHRSAFEDALEEVGQEQTERLRLEITGPLAPWDFADIDAWVADERVGVG
jgi:hypothetical protein